jgi:4-hydroxyphenylpyruvate dioxygenase
MKIEHVHFYVEDAKAWRDWFVHKLGFQALATSHMNLDHTCTEVVRSGSICFLLSSPLLPISPVAEFLSQHPPGVADVAFGVQNVEEMILNAQAHGAKVLQPVQRYQQGQEYLKSGKIAAWGSLSHTLIERATDKITDVTDGLSASSVNNLSAISVVKSVASFTAIDHIVLNVDAGDLERAVSWYENCLGFQPQQAFKIKTARSALHSQVMISSNGGVQFPINEPASANSQIQEFLNVNRGAGIQHIALRTCNLIPAIAHLRANNLFLLPAPKDYYSQIQQRKGFPLSLDELQAIAQQEILVDWQDNLSSENAKITPLLLQIFTQPIFGKPTFFFEFIERRYQAQGFGEGNFRTLFKAIENEQLKRGSLEDFVT